MDAAAAAAQLPLSTYTVQDSSQGVVPSTMARSFFPPQNNPHMYGQRPVSQVALDPVKLTALGKEGQEAHSPHSTRSSSSGSLSAYSCTLCCAAA